MIHEFNEECGPLPTCVLSTLMYQPLGRAGSLQKKDCFPPPKAARGEAGVDEEGRGDPDPDTLGNLAGEVGTDPLMAVAAGEPGK